MLKTRSEQYPIKVAVLMNFRPVPPVSVVCLVAILWMIAVCAPAQAKVEDIRPSGGRPEKPEAKTTGAMGFLGKLLSPTPQLAIVPIPQSNPTLGTGLTLAAIYFYAQDEAQKRVQPPSSTQGFAMYRYSAFGPRVNHSLDPANEDI